jgi:hypothetical protein
MIGSPTSEGVKRIKGNLTSDGVRRLRGRVIILAWSQPLGPNGREASSKTIMMVSWVDMARQDSWEWETYSNRVSSREGSCQKTRISSLIEGASNQEDWRSIMVVDTMHGIEILLGWEKKILTND